MCGSWHPLLAGSLADRAWEAIEEVACALREPVSRPPTDGDPENSQDPSLAGGDAGIALFLAYLAEVRSDEVVARESVHRLDRALAGLEALPMAPGLYIGFSGVGWTADHLKGRLLDTEEIHEDPNQVIDEALRSILCQSGELEHYDLIGGLAGLCLYALEGMRRPIARDLVGLLLQRLEELAEDDATGSTWWTPPALVPAHSKTQYPRGYYDLGVAHGVAGMIGVLGHICAAGLWPDRSQPLLSRAVSWLLQQELAPPSASRFPYWLAPGLDPRPARLAWCYGDAGLAATVLLAARSAGDQEWEREATRIARHAASRSKESAGVLDAGLCHGAAGLGHLFNRLYQATGDGLLGSAARSWFRNALEMRRKGESCGGFLSWAGEGPAGTIWRTDQGFLTGGAGIALALLAAVSSVPPDWDRLLLCDLSPRGVSRQPE